MQIAICDDLKPDSEWLASVIKTYLKENEIKATIYMYSSGENFIKDFEPGKYDLVFLDVYMKEISGIETAKRLRETDERCKIIFCTTSCEHGADSYDVNAFYYLVKPVEVQKLYEVMNKYITEGFTEKIIQIKVGRNTESVFLSEIKYIEAYEKKAIIHTKTADIATSMSLMQIERMLPKNDFCKPIRYAIVSLHEIKNIPTDRLVLMDGTEIPISRNEKKNIRNMFADFKWRKLRSDI